MALRALVVDPSLARSRVCRQLLREKGLEVLVAADGQQACDVLESSGQICLLWTELSLPLLDGFGVLRRLQASQSAGIPVLVTAASRELRSAAMDLREELGISALLSSSEPAHVLRDVIERILEGEEDIVGDDEGEPEPPSVSPNTPPEAKSGFRIRC